MVILERGQPVESRGRDIGALIVRRLLNTESNLCYGGAHLFSPGLVNNDLMDFFAFGGGAHDTDKVTVYNCNNVTIV